MSYINSTMLIHDSILAEFNTDFDVFYGKMMKTLFEGYKLPSYALGYPPNHPMCRSIMPPEQTDHELLRDGPRE